MLDAAQLSLLLAVAARLSGLAPMPVGELPPVDWLPAAELRATACPEAGRTCDNLVALFESEPRRILLSRELDPQDLRDQSFIVHELVHVLEHRQQGEAWQRDCAAALVSERAAYRTQNAFLRESGRSERYGGMLLSAVCANGQAAGQSVLQLELVRNDELSLQAFMDDLQRRPRSALADRPAAAGAADPVAPPARPRTGRRTACAARPAAAAASAAASSTVAGAKRAAGRGCAA